MATQEQLDTFRDMCMKHDLTYDYSDDHRYYVKGRESYGKLELYALKNLSREEAQKIWNEVVDTKIVEDARERFYWK